MRYLITFYKDFVIRCTIYVVICTIFYSCQKDLDLDYDIAPIKQVIISNLNVGNKLRVNISKSKEPDDFTSVDFLTNCKVDLFEDGIFKETIPFILRDTLSGLGYYTSSFNLKKNKTYKIISTHTTLGIAEATEYLPAKPTIINFELLSHADVSNPTKNGKYIITFQDSANWNNYYYLATFYKILKPTIDDTGDTIYNYGNIWNIISNTPEIPNTTNFNRLFTTDTTFDGQIKSFIIDFPSQYNNVYKEIFLVVELSNCGKNFYEWNKQQIPIETEFNEGQLERNNLKSNIINGYGHFTANNSSYISIPIK